MRRLTGELIAALRLLRRRRRWLPELIILLAFASVVGFTIQHLPQQSARVPAFILTALGFFPLWLIRIYWEAKGWRAAQRESKLDDIRAGLILDAPVLYRLVWSAPVVCLAWLACSGPEMSLTRTGMAVSSIYLASSFLHYLIQWTTIWMKTGAPFPDFVWSASLGFLALIHPIFMVPWLVWLRWWSAPRLAKIRWIHD